MLEGCPEHGFFSQPQLKFPMFVFSFTMFSVKNELLQPAAEPVFRDKKVCFRAVMVIQHVGAFGSSSSVTDLTERS